MENPINSAKSFDLSVEDYFLMLSDTIHDHTVNDRHKVIKNFEPNFNLLRNLDPDDVDQHDKDDVCVVYMVWDNFAYVKYALLSIMSNYVHTDLIRFPLKVVFGGDLIKYENVIRPIFEALGAEVIFGHEYKFKYTIPNLFSDYRFVFNVDADTFFFGGRNDIYKDIKTYYLGIKKANSLREPYIVCHEELDWTTKTRFFHPLEAVPPGSFNLDHKEDKNGFIDFWSECEYLDLTTDEIFQRLRGGWVWNIFSAYEPNLWSSHEDWDEYSKFCKDDLEVWDDEFVYELWSWDNDIPKTYLDAFEKIRMERSSLDFLEEDDEEKRTGITHPINAYKEIDEVEVKAFFDLIQMQFERKVLQNHDF